jgi:hypothetical protein
MAEQEEKNPAPTATPAPATTPAPNPIVTDNDNGTKTLTYRETADQQRIRETSEKATGTGSTTSS